MRLDVKRGLSESFKDLEGSENVLHGRSVLDPGCGETEAEEAEMEDFSLSMHVRPYFTYKIQTHGIIPIF